MKQKKRTLAILLVLVVFVSLALTGCNARRYTYTDEAIRSAVTNAAKAQMKSIAGTGDLADYIVKTEKQGRKSVDVITVDEVSEQDDGIWVAKGTASFVNAKDKSDEIDVKYELKVELIDYVTDATPVLKFVDFKLVEE